MAGRAGEKETIVRKTLLSKARRLRLQGKKKYRKRGVEISTDDSFRHLGRLFLIEIDSGNMAKLLVGQYVLLNGLCRAKREKVVFLVIHTYKGYNPGRTTSNLAYAKKTILRGSGFGFGAIHLTQLEDWDGGSVRELVGLFTD